MAKGEEERRNCQRAEGILSKGLPNKIEKSPQLFMFNLATNHYSTADI
jgi:hypothetical protein